MRGSPGRTVLCLGRESHTAPVPLTGSRFQGRGAADWLRFLQMVSLIEEELVGGIWLGPSVRCSDGGGCGRGAPVAVTARNAAAAAALAWA